MVNYLLYYRGSSTADAAHRRWIYAIKVTLAYTTSPQVVDGAVDDTLSAQHYRCKRSMAPSTMHWAENPKQVSNASFEVLMWLLNPYLS